MAESNDNSGALFKNDKGRSATSPSAITAAGGNPRWPDYKGSATVAGVEYWVSSWIKTAKSGAKYMSLSFQPKSEAQRKPRPAPAPAKEFNDDIPF